MSGRVLSRRSWMMLISFVYLVLWLLVVGGELSPLNFHQIDEEHSHRQLGSAGKVDSKGCVKWGNTFDVPLVSKTVEQPCALPDGRKICCSATDTAARRGDMYAKPVGDNYFPRSKARDEETASRDNQVCTMTKVYVSSPQELRDLAVADRISRISRDHTDPARFKALMDYVLHPETLRNASVWLDRVAVHMAQPALSTDQITASDMEFLSRFEITRVCGNEVTKWVEWIEPVTITARHPYSFGACRPVRPLLQRDTPKTGRSNVDYVLLQSGRALFDRSYSAGSGKRLRFQSEETKRRSRGNRPVKHYLLDAGTSTFDSSLYWFTCGYSQRKIGFDGVYGWEMTLLDPRDYWRRVPQRWKPYWHFYNVPISANFTEADSPIAFLKELARPEDFVSFKLDIDSPDHEMPVAQHLLQNAEFAELVDEFFFELHFRCEVMTSCGWGKRVPAESHGLKLDRPDILRFFIDLRKRGIRAHIWP